MKYWHEVIEKEKLVDTSSFFDLLLKKSTTSTIFLLNKEGIIVKVNESVNKFYGYKPEELIGKKLTVLLTNDERQNINIDKELEAVLENGSASHFRYFVHKNGTPIWTQGETFPLKVKDHVYFIKILHDVKQQELLEEFIIASEKRQTLLSSIFDSFLNGIEVFKCIRNSENQIIDFEYILINKAAENFMGKSRNEIIGKKLLWLYPDLKKIGVFDLQKRVVESGISEVAEFYFNQHGLNGWFKASVVKFGDGLIVTLEDKSEIKSSNSELIKTNVFLQDSQELGKVGNLEYDIIKDKISGTPALYKLLGFEKDSVNLNDYMKNIYDEDRERVESAIMSSMHKKEPTEIEYRYTLPDGRLRTFFVRAKTVFDENDQPERMIGTVADITKIKRVESELKKSEEIITRYSSDQEKVKERTEELLIANRQLKTIIEELDKYAYIISHDLRAPLNSMEGLIFLLGEDYRDKPLDSYGEEMIDMINTKIQSMKELITQVLKSAKADKKIKEPINLYQLAHEVIQTLSPPPNFSIYVEHNIPHVKFHRMSLIQILQNLIGNSIKYMDKEKPIIKINSTEHNSFYEICINDNGLGIPKAKLNKIFNVFEVGHENENIESHGLGLSIVKKLVEDNGGKIFVESEEGIGTTFHFTILKD